MVVRPSPYHALYSVIEKAAVRRLTLATAAIGSAIRSRPAAQSQISVQHPCNCLGFDCSTTGSKLKISDLSAARQPAILRGDYTPADLSPGSTAPTPAPRISHFSRCQNHSFIPAREARKTFNPHRIRSGSVQPDSIGNDPARILLIPRNLPPDHCR